MALGVLLNAHPARAQRVLERFSLRGEFGAGVMISAGQRAVLGLDGAQLQVTGRVGFDVLDWLSLQASVNNGFFLVDGQRPTGRTLVLQLGLRAQPAVGAVGRAWADANAGYVSTGTDRRFGLDGGLGFEFALGRAVALGPFARVSWVPADAVIHEESDALYATFGLSFTLRLPRPAASVAADRDGDGVLDADDQCPSTPQGRGPNPSRRGCPMLDADGDGVADTQDLCASVPAGAQPDPGRRGCPLDDRDGDAVADQEDPCPTEPQGAHPDPARRGCPAGDRDRDGIVDTVDRCPEAPETFNDRDDADGCPDVRASRAGGRIRMSEQIRFSSSSAELRGRRNGAILDAISEIMRASPDIILLHVEGHTDDQGDPARNRDLSNQRAQRVVRELVARGVAASRLAGHGFGSDQPLVQGTSRRARAANRRIDFRVDLDAGGSAAAPGP